MTGMTRRNAIGAMSRNLAKMAIAGAAGIDALPACSASAISVIDHGAVADGITDNTGAFRSAVERAAQSGVEVRVPAGGVFGLASSSLDNAGIRLPNGSRIVGDSGAELRVTGDQPCNLFTVRNASNVRVSGLTLRGNGAQGRFGHGQAFWAFADRAAEADMTNVWIERCEMSNFASARWVSFLNYGAGPYLMKNIGTRSNIYRSIRGNCNDPHLIGAVSNFVDVSAVGGGIQAVTIDDLLMDARWIKQGAQIYGDVDGFLVRVRTIADPGVGEDVTDVGAYGVSVYQLPAGSPRNGRVEVELIANPLSAGVYLAGARDVALKIGRIHGQRDQRDEKLPKAAIVCNGCRGIDIEASALDDNYCGLSINAPDGGGRQLRSDISFAGKISNSALANVRIRANVNTPWFGGIRISGEMVGGRYGVLLDSTATGGLSDIDLSDLTTRSSRFGIFMGFVNGMKVRNITISGHHNGTQAAIYCDDASRVSNVLITDAVISGPAKDELLRLINAPDVRLDRVEFRDQPSGAAVNLEGAAIVQMTDVRFTNVQRRNLPTRQRPL